MVEVYSVGGVERDDEEIIDIRTKVMEEEDESEGESRGVGG